MELLKFYSHTCGPCRVLDKQLSDLNIYHKSIDIMNEDNDDLCSKYSIRNVPTLILVDDQGSVIRKHVGLFENEEKLKEFAD